jgi:hypothetical protein
MENCPSCGKKLKVSVGGILYCPDRENCGYELRSDWLGGEKVHYRCPICLTANDPEVFAMKKHGKYWYHEICLNKALWHFLDNFDYRLDEQLNFVSCMPKKGLLDLFHPDLAKKYKQVKK